MFFCSVCDRQDQSGTWPVHYWNCHGEDYFGSDRRYRQVKDSGVLVFDFVGKFGNQEKSDMDMVECLRAIHSLTFQGQYSCGCGRYQRRTEENGFYHIWVCLSGWSPLSLVLSFLGWPLEKKKAYPTTVFHIKHFTGGDRGWGGGVVRDGFQQSATCGMIES